MKELVKCNGQLHNTEVGRQMSAVVGNGFNNLFSELGTQMETLLKRAGLWRDEA